LTLLLGIDLIEVARIAAAVDRWGNRFLNRVYAAGEIQPRRHRDALAQHLAGRFAAKEAAMKALGTGWRGVHFREIVIGRAASGRPVIRFEGKALARSRALSVIQSEVTITHTAEMAAAVVALVCGGPAATSAGRSRNRKAATVRRPRRGSPP